MLSIACIGDEPALRATSYVAGRRLAIRKRSAELAFRIPQSWFDSVVYLYPDIARAQAGEQVGGTGFLLGWPVADTGLLAMWVVTNRHVIEEGGHWTVRINKKDGGIECIDTTDEEWVLSPDSDLAVRPIRLSQDVHGFNYLTKEWLLTKEWFDALDIGPGDECITIGRFIGHDGRGRNYPTARFGQISQGPNEPVKISGKMQECFLVESRSIGGTSGSPVYLHFDPVSYRPSINGKTAPDGSKLFQGVFPRERWLLGICFAMTPIWQQVCDTHRVELQQGWKVSLNTGMMGVVPSWQLLNLMEGDYTLQTRNHVEELVRMEIIKRNSDSEMTPTG